jgi:hypothetical protein
MPQPFLDWKLGAKCLIAIAPGQGSNLNGLGILFLHFGGNFHELIIIINYIGYFLCILHRVFGKKLVQRVFYPNMIKSYPQMPSPFLNVPFTFYNPIQHPKEPIPSLDMLSTFASLS